MVRGWYGGVGMQQKHLLRAAIFAVGLAMPQDSASLRGARLAALKMQQKHFLRAAVFAVDSAMPQDSASLRGSAALKNATKTIAEGSRFCGRLGYATGLRFAPWRMLGAVPESFKNATFFLLRAAVLWGMLGYASGFHFAPWRVQ